MFSDRKLTAVITAEQRHQRGCLTFIAVGSTAPSAASNLRARSTYLCLRCFALKAFPYPETTLHDDMNTATESLDKPWITSSTLRVRRHRERRREGLRLPTLEMPEPAIETAVVRGFLKPEETTQAWSVIQSVYAAQLSDRALNAALEWLIKGGVITEDQRVSPRRLTSA
jgi:hypothetical protein